MTITKFFSQFTKGQKISKKKSCCPGFFQKPNAGAILCSENCPSVRFLEESRTSLFFLSRLLTFSMYLTVTQLLSHKNVHIFVKAGRHLEEVAEISKNSPKQFPVDTKVYKQQQSAQISYLAMLNIDSYSLAETNIDS